MPTEEQRQIYELKGRIYKLKAQVDFLYKHSGSLLWRKLMLPMTRPWSMPCGREMSWRPSKHIG